MQLKESFRHLFSRRRYVHEGTQVDMTSKEIQALKNGMENYKEISEMQDMTIFNAKMANEISTGRAEKANADRLNIQGRVIKLTEELSRSESLIQTLIERNKELESENAQLKEKLTPTSPSPHVPQTASSTQPPT